LEDRPEEAIGVAELARRLRRAVEGATGREWVEGEVTGFRAAASGHLYFSLKDEREDASIDCVVYRMQALRARRHLLDGARVQILGRATVWAPRGRLQFVGEQARPAGKGALLAALEALKEKLKAEGLFDPARKRALPENPKIVGVVTSSHGAAIHDIVTVAFRRGYVRIVLSPAQVQGDGAAASIVRAIDRIERYPHLDVLIVGRGGGSNEDLSAFNDERVVRRIARATVPIVSAVGHEVDTTLTDWVADVRAATPSEAAEIVVPDRASRADSLVRAKLALVRAMRSRLLEDAHAVHGLRSKLSDPRFFIADRQQYVDLLRGRLERRFANTRGRRKTTLETLRVRLSSRHPRAVVANARAELGPLTAKLGAVATLKLERAHSVLGEAASRLDALSPLSVLSRGYAIVTRGDGRAVRVTKDVTVGEDVGIRVHGGHVAARVTGTRESSS
jgi:exodeoxyribonuclease VII large subunit